MHNPVPVTCTMANLLSASFKLSRAVLNIRNTMQRLDPSRYALLLHTYILCQESCYFLHLNVLQINVWKQREPGSEVLSRDSDPGLHGLHVTNAYTQFEYCSVYMLIHMYIMLQIMKIRAREPFEEFWSGYSLIAHSTV